MATVRSMADGDEDDGDDACGRVPTDALMRKYARTHAWGTWPRTRKLP